MTQDVLQPSVKLKAYEQFGRSGKKVREKLNNAFLGLPSMQVTDTVITSNDPYKPEYDENNNLRAIRAGHFDTAATRVEKHLDFESDPFVWLQTLIKQKGLPTQTTEGEKSISGFIINFLTPGDQVLMIADNEPAAPAEKNRNDEEIHPVLRHLIQTGMPKYTDILEGKQIKDPVLGKIMELGILTRERMEADWSISLHDTTRMSGENIVSTVRLTHDEVEKLAEALPVLAFTFQELRILNAVGKYLPPHTMNAALIDTLLEPRNAFEKVKAWVSQVRLGLE